ncbi:TAP42-like family [Rhizoctonia solani]|uniref:TAP42-like family n=1 Tax=Rhizoctonia solani TaxID=456999 RepID=A0A8H7I425_9AGAM|nr:TAP42-like family [Rhizoctonia solani]
MSGELPLSARYDQALASSSRLSEYSALSPEYKSLSDEALRDLRQVAQAVSDLQLFSRNETLEDISTKQLVYLTVPYATAELLLALPSAEPAIRKDILGQAEALRSQTLAANIEEPSNNYDSIRMLISSGASHAGSVNVDDDDLDMDDETRRELTITLLRLLYAQTQSSLQQIKEEAQILQNMPHPPAAILNPKQAPERVFRPDHRLPTMSIDEYLAEEERRGNILRGGVTELSHRKASEQAPTSSEQLAVDSEQDGTRFGEEKSEEKRKKDEEWAVFTDANPKGAGNTMNRG